MVYRYSNRRIPSQMVNVVNVVCDAPLEETLYSTSRFMTLKIIIIQLNPITEFDQDHNEWLEKIAKGCSSRSCILGPS